MFCPYCGAQVRAGSKICSNCNRRMPELEAFHFKNKPTDFEDIYSGSAIDESIVQNKDIYSRSKETAKKPKSKKRKPHIFAKTILSLISLGLVFLIAAGSWFITSINKIDRVIPAGDLSVFPSLDDQVRNIALFGLDSRDNNYVGRSDAVLVLSIDKRHNSIKLTSIARDTYVDISGHGKDKLTHAWAYGKSDLAIQTLNRNFELDISDFIAINFYQFATIIDAIGGVTVDVSADEMKAINKHCVPHIQSLGISCEKITKAGFQLLSGGQALAYSRDRTTGGDIERGNRQKEILAAMIEKLKSTSVTKYPSIINIMTENCQTSLSNSDIVGLCAWAFVKKPNLATLSLPNDDCNAKGKVIKRVWYYVYDLNVAIEELRSFIYDNQIDD